MANLSVPSPGKWMLDIFGKTMFLTFLLEFPKYGTMSLMLVRIYGDLAISPEGVFFQIGPTFPYLFPNSDPFASTNHFFRFLFRRLGGPGP